MTAVSSPVPAQPPTAAVDVAVGYLLSKGWGSPLWSDVKRDVAGAVAAAAPLIRAQALREAATAVKARREHCEWYELDAYSDAAALIRGLVEGDGS